MTGRLEWTGNPNSQNQTWTRWTFGVEANPDKLPTIQQCKPNFARWCAMGFRSTTGRARVIKPSVLDYLFQVEIEGPPAHDPAFRTHVKRQFIEHFMFKGFGYSARLVRFEVLPLAGQRDDGKPADQLIVMPPLSDLLKGLPQDG